MKSMSSVYNACLTLFEITVLGEAWGDIMYPLADSNNSWVLALTIYFCVFFTVVIGLMNLVLAVIVDFAVDARDDDARMKTMQQDKLKKDAKKHLDGLCKELDEDNNRTLTQEEF